MYRSLCLFVFLASCSPAPQTTEVTFDALEAMQTCHRHQGPRAQKRHQKREIEDRVLSRVGAPDQCGEYAELLDAIEEGEAQLDDALLAQDYLQVQP